MKKSLCLLVASAMILSIASLALPGTARADDWTKVADRGVDGQYQMIVQRVTSTLADNINLYVGTSSQPVGFSVWRYNGTVWTQIAREGLGDPLSTEVSAMAMYQGKLYCGTTRLYGQQNGTSLWTWDGAHWTEVTHNAFGNNGIQSFDSMEVLDNKLYVGSFDAFDGTKVFMFDGHSWTRVNTDGFGQSAWNSDTEWLSSDGTDLFAGVRNDRDGCKLFKYDGGTNWTQLGADGFGDADNHMTGANATYGTEAGSFILMGTQNVVTGGQLWLYDASADTFTQVNQSGFGNPLTIDMTSIEIAEGGFYVGTANKDEHGGAAPCQLWFYPSPDWSRWQTDWVQKLSASIPGAPGLFSEITSLNNFQDRLIGSFFCPTGPTSIYASTNGVNWSTIANAGLVSEDNISVQSLAQCAGQLYAGTLNGTLTGSMVFRQDPDGWTAIQRNGYDTPKLNQMTSSMVEYEGQLYAGTSDGCCVYRYDGSSWAQVNIAQFSNPQNTGVHAMVIYNGKLYASTESGGEVWCYDGSSWTRVLAMGSAGTITALAVYNGSLYAGTNPIKGEGDVLRYDGGTAWKAVAPHGFGVGANLDALAVYGGQLCAGIWIPGSKQCQVWAWSGSGAWRSISRVGLGAGETHVNAMAAFSGKLYAASDNSARVWVYDGKGWAKSNADGFGDANNVAAESMCVVGDSLYVGTQNLNYGAQIWRISAPIPPVSPRAFYFAEGTTRPDFDTYFTVENPSSSTAEVRLTYMTGAGARETQGISIAPTSRATVHPADVLGIGDDAEHDFSTVIESTNNVGIVAERPMYFNYKGVWNGGHDVVGANAPDTSWYFAEGTTRTGFDPYLSIANPGTAAAEVRVTYMKGDGKTDTQMLSVAPGSRGTLHPADVIGTGDDASCDFSASVVSQNGVPIVAERPMYFNYMGKWTGGSDVLGAGAPAPDWYFAEGTCRSDFDPYICIQNPGGGTADIQVTYMKGNGTTVEQTASVGPNSRTTIPVHAVLGTGDDASYDFSARVHCSNGEVICERPMYFNFQGKWNGGHDVVGATGASPTFYFAEGTARPGFDAYLAIQNPGDLAVNVTAVYLKGDGKTASQSATVSARSRWTLHPSDVLGTGADAAHDFSIIVSCEPGGQLIVERPMYFDYHGWTGGSDTIGYVPAQ